MTVLTHSNAAPVRSDRAGDGDFLPPSPATHTSSDGGFLDFAATLSAPTGSASEAMPVPHRFHDAWTTRREFRW